MRETTSDSNYDAHAQGVAMAKKNCLFAHQQEVAMAKKKYMFLSQLILVGGSRKQGLTHKVVMCAPNAIEHL